MTRGKIGGFLVHLVILAALLLLLTRIVFGFHAKMLIGEFLLLLFFVCMAFVCMAGKLLEGNWSNYGLSILYGLNMINFLFIWLIDKNLIATYSLISILGFIIALTAAVRYQEEDDFDLAETAEPSEPKNEVKTSFEPGKYVASKTGKKFHAPKCDWAKKINKKRQVWFNSKEEAEAKDLKACDCVE